MYVVAINLLLLTFIITVKSLEPVNNQNDILTKIVDLLSKKNKVAGERRLADPEKPKQVLRMLTLSNGHNDHGHDVNSEEKLAEEELKYSLLNRQPALLDRPVVESAGKHDYLVLHPMFVDRQVTVIPNAIYYNIEKKCVNWLDDCSLKGIRQKLLRGVRSPYK